MSLVLADEKQLVRDMLGDPDITELPEANLGRFFTEGALRWINQRRPGVALTSFTSVANQQDYDSKPATAYRIKDVFWMSVDIPLYTPTVAVALDRGYQSQDLGGISTFDNPAIVEAFYQKIAYYNNSFKGTGEETAEGKIRLMPAPTTGGDTVYFTYTYPRWSDVTNTPAEFVDAVRNIAAAAAARFLAIKRGKITSGRNWSGGAGILENEMRKEFLEAADALAPQMSGIDVG
ncbi:MAG: hypothetical protein DRI65_17430 [Chloroflexota bacterium]|nr:MAG: hypothetical protein DRI65_17430 [Chloroflexota bacterium]